MIPISKISRAVQTLALLAIATPMAHGFEHVTLANGFELDCVRTEKVGDKIRLYFSASGQNYQELAATTIARIETIPDPPAPTAPQSPRPNPSQP